MTAPSLDGFWLPAHLRDAALADATWEKAWLQGGTLLDAPGTGAVAVRWPHLSQRGWRVLLNGLQRGRQLEGTKVLDRWQSALAAARSALADDAPAFTPVLSAATGYSPQMLNAGLWHDQVVNPGLLLRAVAFRPSWNSASAWESMPGLAGRVRYFPARASDRFLAGWRKQVQLGRPAESSSLVLGYAAGNVPGTGVLMSVLGSAANAASASAAPAPAVLVRNSRHEPLFAPWMLAAIEGVDPGLVSGLAALVWDAADDSIQQQLMGSADLMLAAAGDEAIASLDSLRARFRPQLRFHRHGHKVSFAAVEHPTEASIQLAALDSVLWDQNGCLSARVHFVVSDADAYAQSLVSALRGLATVLPRGNTPLRWVHRAFDSYKGLEGDEAPARPGGRSVTVYSSYGDDFCLVMDRRPWDADTLRRATNACQGRVIVVHPVRDVFEIPRLLGGLPPAYLQSISIDISSPSVPDFATAVGQQGITALRSLGRAALPQLAYSWDGYLPLDMSWLRPPGHFTTIEFDDRDAAQRPSADGRRA